MTAEVRSVWDENKRRPNVWLNIKAENDTERALLRALYSVRGKVTNLTDGGLMIDFYPQGEPRG